MDRAQEHIRATLSILLHRSLVMEFLSLPAEFGFVIPYLLVQCLVGCGVVGRAGFPVMCLQVHPREGEKKRLVV